MIRRLEDTNVVETVVVEGAEFSLGRLSAATSCSKEALGL